MPQATDALRSPVCARMRWPPCGTQDAHQFGEPTMTHILGLIASPRKGGNTEILMERVLAAAREEGAQTRVFSVAGKTIAPCTACDACARGEVEFCAVDDDMMELYPLMQWADIIVFGSPVYMGTMTAQLKAIFDRARSLWRVPGGMLHKGAAAVVVGEGRWGRQEFAVQTIWWAATNHGMIVLEPEADVCGVANEPGDILRDERALRDAEALGRRLAHISTCALGRTDLGSRPPSAGE